MNQKNESENDSEIDAKRNQTHADAGHSKISRLKMKNSSIVTLRVGCFVLWVHRTKTNGRVEFLLKVGCVDCESHEDV
jgi:hypothetical protein